jgi:deoxyribose-phosphate aldolase
MSVRKHTWKNAKDEMQEAWIADYPDQKGKRQIKTFEKKKAVGAHHATVKVEGRQGTHTADRESVTIAEAGKHWIKTGEGNNPKRATLEEYI